MELFSLNSVDSAPPDRSNRVGGSFAKQEGEVNNAASKRSRVDQSDRQAAARLLGL